MDDTINYRDLLKKYMDHVGNCEGTYFIRGLREGYHFDGDEIKILEDISKEIG